MARTPALVLLVALNSPGLGVYLWPALTAPVVLLISMRVTSRQAARRQSNRP